MPAAAHPDRPEDGIDRADLAWLAACVDRVEDAHNRAVVADADGRIRTWVQRRVPASRLVRAAGPHGTYLTVVFSDGAALRAAATSPDHATAVTFAVAEARRRGAGITLDHVALDPEDGLVHIGLVAGGIPTSLIATHVWVLAPPGPARPTR